MQGSQVGKVTQAVEDSNCTTLHDPYWMMLVFGKE